MTTALEEYTALKLEAAQAVRTIMDLARRAADEDGEQRARDLLARLAEDRFNLAVVGLFNRGKSSLINALLGTDRLPTGVLPVTSAITTAGYGDREQVLIHFRGSPLPTQVRLQELAAYASESGNPGNRLAVERAEIRLPSPLLRLGFFFVDTPGVGSAIAANTETTRRFLPEIDAAVFLTSFEAPLGQADVALLSDLREQVRTVFVVANKADVVSEEEREDALRFMRERLAVMPDSAESPILAVSARTGAGIPELHAALSRFLSEQKLPALLYGIIRRAQAIADRQALRLAMSAQGHADPSRAAGAREAFHGGVERLRVEAAAALNGLRAAVAGELEARMSGEVDAYCAPSPEPHEPLERWLDQHRETVRSHLVKIARPHARRLSELIAAPERMGADLAGVPLPPPPSAADPTSWLDEVPVVQPAVLPVIDWRVPAPPRWARLPLLRSRARRLAERARDQAVSERRAAMSTLLVERGEEWASRVTATLTRRFAASIAATERALSAAPDTAAQAELDGALARLASLEGRIAAGPLSDSGVVRPSGVERAPRRCGFCAAIRAAVFDFMSAEQHELAFSERRRRDYVTQGFCPQHLWEFERLASPRGLCVGYAPVLADLGSRLAALSEAASSGVLRAGVDALSTTARDCPACRVARRAEDAKLRGDIASDSLLCLGHLSYVVQRTSDVAAARALVADQARLVRRVADDMRSHALKADALRRDLFTESEASAHLRGVCVVAGERGVHSTRPAADAL